MDVKTGVRKWHYQLVHHGMWDMDIPCAAILTDITVNGRTVKALAQPTKQAFLYVLNRETGEPIWPFEERPVPKGRHARRVVFTHAAVSDQTTGMTARGLSIDDLIDFTPELRAQATQLVSKYRLGPMFTPPSVSRPEGPIATLTMGAQATASNWPGGSCDPETHGVRGLADLGLRRLALCHHRQDGLDAVRGIRAQCCPAHAPVADRDQQQALLAVAAATRQPSKPAAAQRSRCRDCRS